MQEILEDISILPYVIVGLVGVGVGWLLSSYKHAQDKIESLAKRAEIMTELSVTKQQLVQNKYWRNEIKLLNNELHNLRNIKTSLELNLREVAVRLESTKLHTEDKIRQMADNEQRLNEQFEKLANRIFEQSNRLINEQNRQSLHVLLTPLFEQLDIFRRQIQENFSQEACERRTLTHEIYNLQQLNAQIAQEAINLTRALKGNNKIQGDWGEVILTRVLEASGLREGHEYETQVSIENDDNIRMQPDVIIHLPQGKDVVVDAKITLVAYERYFNAEDDLTRESALQEYMTSVHNHIRSLSRKDYHQLPTLRSLNYVLMFIPVETAFLLALNKQPELINEALRNNIMLVSPTTLLVALRTIANLWCHEYQNQNTQNIAKCASKLYDKIRLFVEDMLTIGQSLDRAQYNYRQAMKKLSLGRSNIILQAETFRSFGVETKRKINKKSVEQVIARDEEYCFRDRNGQNNHISDNDLDISDNTNL